MKKPLLLLLGAFICLTAFWSPIQKTIHHLAEKTEKEFEDDDEDEGEEEKEKEAGVSGQMMSWFTARAFPDPYYLNDKYLNGWYQAQAIRNQQVSLRGAGIQSGTWASIGPNNSIGGRILTIAVDPTNSNKLFCGSASGGIWKSTNGGTLWSPVVTDLPVLGVSSIIIHPTNGNIIYAGTGEVYRIDSTSGTPNPGNTGFSVWKTRGTYGMGIVKSTDGGVTWTQVLNRSTSQLFAIQNLRFDPANPNTVYACATDGLWRTTDAGVTWTKIFAITYVSDVAINGTNIVISVGNLGNTLKGIYKSTNSGSTWAKITSGLPASFQGFIEMDWVASDPNTIVASIGVSEAAGVNELYRSTNFGTSWTALASSTHTQWQYWCAHDLAINPSNTDAIVFGGVDTYRYTISTATKSSAITTIHDDIHDVKFDPSNNAIVYVCCDGGIYKSTNSGSTFSAINNGLGATQFYASLGVSTTDPNMFVGGLQDNGQVYYNGTSWTTVSGVGGDGTSCAVDPNNDNNVLVSRDARGVYRSTNGAASASNTATYWGSVADSRTAFAAPIAFSKSNPTIAYIGSDNLHKSTNGGSTWTNNSYSGATGYIDALHKTAITLAVSPTDPNKVYMSVSNFAQYDGDVDNLYLTGNPNVLKTTNGAPPGTSIMGTGANTLPNRFVMDFAIDPTNDNIVFAAIGGFGTQHVYKTSDGGANWTAVGGGLPDVPFNAVLIDPLNPQVLYAGGDLGVYVSPNRGGTWYDYNTGFWDATQVVDLQATSDNQLVAATHGKGVFKGARFSPTLPVTILSFTGEVKSAANSLQWKVAQEININRYELERSTDGSSFQKIGSVSANNSGTYTYSDAISSAVSYYYRLKAVENDGTYKYSDIVYLKRSSKNVLQVLGNPFTNSMQVQLNFTQYGKSQINLYNATGQLLRSETVAITSSQQVYYLDNLAILPSGTYFVEAVMNNQRWKQKVLKK